MYFDLYTKNRVVENKYKEYIGFVHLEHRFADINRYVHKCCIIKVLSKNI